MAQSPQQTVRFSDTLALQIYDDGQYLIYTISGNSRQTTDTYIEDVMDRLRAWENGNLFIVHDMSAPNMTLTPYFQRRLDEVSAYLRESQKSGFSAVILPNTFMSQLISIFAMVFNRRNGNFSQRLFTSLADGKEWMTEKIAENKSVAEK